MRHYPNCSCNRAEDAGGPACRANRLLLRQQNPYLAEEGLWAEPIDSVHAGTLLVATPRAGHRNPRYEQLVVLVLEHSDSGTSGVILNRPCAAMVDDLLGWGYVNGCPAADQRARLGFAVDRPPCTSSQPLLTLLLLAGGRQAKAAHR